MIEDMKDSTLAKFIARAIQMDCGYHRDECPLGAEEFCHKMDEQGVTECQYVIEKWLYEDASFDYEKRENLHFKKIEDAIEVIKSLDQEGRNFELWKTNDHYTLEIMEVYED